MEAINKLKSDLEILKQTTTFTTEAFKHQWPGGKLEETNMVKVNGSYRLAMTISDYLNRHTAEILAQCIKDQEADILAAEEARLAEAKAVIEQLEPEIVAAKMAADIQPMQDMTLSK